MQQIDGLFVNYEVSMNMETKSQIDKKSKKIKIKQPTDTYLYMPYAYT